MRAVLRTQRYAARTEKAYYDWVRRYVKFHGMRSRADLTDGTRKVCLNESDAAQREKYLKTAWRKRSVNGRLRRYLTG